MSVDKTWSRPASATTHTPVPEIPPSESLQRISRLLQKAWHIYRTETKPGQVMKIWWEDDQTILFERRLPGPSTPQESDPIEPADTKPLQQAGILSFLCCRDCVGIFHSTLNWWLKDLCTTINEVHVALKPPRIRLVEVAPDGRRCDNSTFVHTLWIPTLHDGSRHALDLTSAQYGWIEPAITWSEFQSDRCEEMVGINRNGSEHEDILSLSLIGDRHETWKMEMMTGFDWRMRIGIKESNWKAAKLLQLSDEDFEHFENRYLDMAKAAAHIAADIGWKTLIEQEEDKEQVAALSITRNFGI